MSEPVKPTKFKWNAILLILVVTFLLFFYFSASHSPKEITWSYFKNELLAKHKVDRITIINQKRVEVFLKQQKNSLNQMNRLNNSVHFYNDINPNYFFQIGSIDFFEAQLQEAQKSLPESDKIIETYVNETETWTDTLVWIIPLVLLFFFWGLWKRILNSGMPGNLGVFDFGKSKPTEYNLTSKKNKITLKDVAGYEEAKCEILELIQFLKNPDIYKSLGAKIPRGILLLGPSGTGKTLLAKALAGEADVPFFSLSGSEFVELFVGIGAARVRDLFAKAKEKAPSIIFIDEIDSIGRIRSVAASMQVNDERESTLNQLLSEMDGFDSNTNIIVIAASNRPDILDSALLRPGRFDRHLYLDLPNKKEREEIFNVHCAGLKLETTVKSVDLAALTPGFSGADIANICNEAALIAARNKMSSISIKDFHEALDRIILGPEKKTKTISESEKRIIAIHETGHALVAYQLKNQKGIHKLSIIPRGKSLGSTGFIFEEKQIYTQSQLNDLICILLSGKAAEEVILNECSSGAVDDLEKATQQAYQMVMQLGLNKELGSLSFNKLIQNQVSFHSIYSEKTASLIDAEVQKLIKSEYQRAVSILEEKKSNLQAISNQLIQKEQIQKIELEELLSEKQELLI